MSLEALNKMNLEFPNIVKELIEDAGNKYQKFIVTKIESCREEELKQIQKTSDLKSKLSAIFLSGLHKTMTEMTVAAES